MVFLAFRDVGYWLQVVCAAVFIYMVMGYRKKAWRHPFAMVGKVLFLIASFLIIHLLLSALTLRFRFLAGIGSWLAYIGGVMLFSYTFCRYSPNARRVIRACCVASIILVNELGAVFGIVLEFFFPPFNSGVVKAAASLTLIPVALFLRSRPVWRYEISRPAADLSVFNSSLSALVVIVYDVFRVHFFGRRENWVNMLLMSVVMTALFLINLVSYQMIVRLSQEHTSVLELQAATQMNKSAASLMAVTESNLNELHKINHDIQNQYAYMRALLARKAYDELDDYFAELTGTFSEPLVPMVECGNRVLDIIFNMERAKAQELGVGLDILAAPPHELPLRDLDLCNLYANVMDNAMEACAAEKIPDAQVSVTVNVSGDYLFTRVTNPTTKDDSFLRGGIGTTKRNKRTHGKGLDIVRGIVKKYGGTMDLRIEHGVFVVEFLLDTCVKEEEAT